MMQGTKATMVVRVRVRYSMVLLYHSFLAHKVFSRLSIIARCRATCSVSFATRPSAKARCAPLNCAKSSAASTSAYSLPGSCVLRASVSMVSRVFMVLVYPKFPNFPHCIFLLLPRYDRKISSQIFLDAGEVFVLQ